MSRQSRETLKGYFREGRRPTEDDFGDLIDSALNINDEGFAKTAADGLRVTSLGDSPSLMGFFSPRSESNQAEWRVGFRDGRLDQLAFRRPAAGEKAPPLMILQGPSLALPLAKEQERIGRIGIGTNEPQDTLDVAGTIRSFGRRGREPLGREGKAQLLVANGEYQPLTGPLRGCHAFEVTAGVGDRHTGRFALVHAIALNTFNPIWWDNLFGLKKRIRSHHAYYSQHADRLQLRWAVCKPDDDPVTGHGDSGAYQLQIRTRRDYRADHRRDGTLKGDAQEVQIRAYVTQLWFDDLTGERSDAAATSAEIGARTSSR